METASAALAPQRALEQEFGLGLRWFCRRYFQTVRTGEELEGRLTAAYARGRVIHVMASSGRVRFLYLVYLLARMGLPPLRAVVGMSRFFIRPWRRLISGETGLAILQALERGGSALVFLRRPSLGEARGAQHEDPFPALVKAARTEAKPILLLPELLVWERSPGHVRPGLLDVLFGSPEAPSGLSQLLAFLRNHNRAFVRSGEPIDLTAFVREHAEESDAALARKVRGALSQHLARQTRAIVGPKLKEPERIIDEVLRDRAFHRSLESAAHANGQPLKSIEAEARRDLREIAAKYSPSLLVFLRPLMSWIFNRIYDGVEVDEAGLSRAMDAATRGPLVFCPSHKSHIDYLLMSWVFAERGMASPHAAAGANLSFFPLGTLFRRGGAFFLRRSFKGDRVYTATFRAYVKKLIKEGASQEFYIEGGRSRTGKLLNPKTGLLSFEVDAYLEGVRDDLFFVPVAIDYEKIVEARSYEKELAGGEKKKEDVRGLLAVPKVLAARYGRIYISFDEPISLRQFLLARRPEVPEDSTSPGVRLGAALSDSDKRKAVVALAHRVVYGINHASTVTPSALLAAVLLTHRQRGIAAHSVSDRIHFLRELARKSGARLSVVLDPQAPSDPTVLGPINESVRLFEDDGLVSHQGSASGPVYRAVDERRRELAFYKNNLMHLTASHALVASSLRSFKGEPAPLAELRERARFLSRLFKLEFIYQVGQTFESIFDDKLRWLVEAGLVLQAAEVLRPAPEDHAQEMLGVLGEMVRDFTESYLLGAKTLHVLLSGARERKELLSEMLERGHAGFLEGQLQCAEAISRPNLENAVELFVELGLLQASEKSKVELTASGREQVQTHALEKDIQRFL